MKKSLLILSIFSLPLAATAQSAAAGGADERTPSRSEYFSWINNTNEGATARQTQTNLAFFQWLHDRYGMVLDLYAFDAGAIDGARMYGSTSSQRFKQQFPEGFGPLSEQAAAMGTRLGVWGGPDGFGHTETEADARMNMMVGLVEKYNFGLFKMDGVCGQLRPEKYDYFNRMMARIRELSPDFVLLNHRLNLGPGQKYSTTFLLGGAETYIDVHMTNTMTAPHHRAQALARENPPGLTRLTEDHGVCLSSCLDYWEDDLVLQAFGRNLILAPEIYGNPWFLRDDELSYLAFLFNLHRDYRELLPAAKALDEETFGPKALSRGNGRTRFVTLRNLTWQPVTYTLPLDSTVGITAGRRVQVRQYHPYVFDLGVHPRGGTVSVTVQPFRAALVKLTTESERDAVLLSGIPYHIVNDRVGREAEVRLLGMPGQTYQVRLQRGSRSFRTAQLDGASLRALTAGKTVEVAFPGQPLTQAWHRQLATLAPCDVPGDAAALYYATAYAADNNSLESRSLKRSGPTGVPQVAAAREAFTSQPLFAARELSDAFLFDGNRQTCFSIARRTGELRAGGESSLLLDLGAAVTLDSLVIDAPDEYSITPLKTAEGTNFLVSSDLVHWKTLTIPAGTHMVLDLSGHAGVRYVRTNPCPHRLSEVTGYVGGRAVDRSAWRASNLFRTYDNAGCKAAHAFTASFTIDEAARGAYLCIAIEGRHGVEGAWAALRVDGRYVGCPDRAPSFVANPWEHLVRNTDTGYTYYVPVTPDMVGRTVEACVLSFKEQALKPTVWLTSYPIPFETRNLTLASN